MQLTSHNAQERDTWGVAHASQALIAGALPTSEACHVLHGLRELCKIDASGAGLQEKNMLPNRSTRQWAWVTTGVAAHPRDHTFDQAQGTKVPLVFVYLMNAVYDTIGRDGDQVTCRCPGAQRHKDAFEHVVFQGNTDKL